MRAAQSTVSTCLMCVPTHPRSHTHLLCCPGHYVGKVRIKGEVRTSMLHERTSLSNLPSSKRKRQRSCFSVRVTDLVAAGVVEPAEAGVVPPNGNPDNVIGRIVSVLALPTANSQARMGSVLLRVQLYWPASVLDVQSAAATVNVELWHQLHDHQSH